MTVIIFINRQQVNNIGSYSCDITTTNYCSTEYIQLPAGSSCKQSQYLLIRSATLSSWYSINGVMPTLEDMSLQTCHCVTIATSPHKLTALRCIWYQEPFYYNYQMARIFVQKVYPLLIFSGRGYRLITLRNI